MEREAAVSASEPLVCLQGGLVVPVEAFNLAIRCESLGIQLSANGAALEAEGPHTPEILAALKRLKPHILALLCYMPDDRHLFDSTVAAPETGPIVKVLHGS